MSIFAVILPINTSFNLHCLIKIFWKFQAIWRGEQVRRKSIGKKIEKIRKRVEEANRSATEEKKLGNRMASALDYLLKFKQLSHILEVLIHLGKIMNLLEMNHFDYNSIS